MIVYRHTVGNKREKFISEGASKDNLSYKLQYIVLEHVSTGINTFDIVHIDK